MQAPPLPSYVTVTLSKVFNVTFLTYKMETDVNNSSQPCKAIVRIKGAYMKTEQCLVHSNCCINGMSYYYVQGIVLCVMENKNMNQTRILLSKCLQSGKSI